MPAGSFSVQPLPWRAVQVHCWLVAPGESATRQQSLRVSITCNISYWLLQSLLHLLPLSAAHMDPSANGQPELVLSDVHVGTCPPGQSVWSTRFMCLAGEFATTPGAATSSLDRDGDLDVSRLSRPRTALTIAHRLETPISTCGTQVWRGACLLADYLLNTPEVVRQKHVLELGAGTGLVGVVAAGAAGSSVILTDACKAALSLACQNAAANLPTWQQRPGPYPSCKGSIVCRHLDWSSFLHTDGSSLTDAELLELLNSQQLAPQQYTDAAEGKAAAAAGSLIENRLQHARSAPPHAGTTHGAPPASSDTWAWQVEDLQQLRHVDVLLAADVVYEPVLTEAFVHTAHALMSWMQKEQARQQPAGTAAASGQTAEDTQPHAQHPGRHTHQGQVPAKGPILYVAAEKRYNFTLRDMDAVATAWDHFMSFVTPADSSSCQRGGAEGHGHTSGGQEPAPALFLGEPVDWRALPQVGVCTSAVALTPRLVPCCVEQGLDAY